MLRGFLIVRFTAAPYHKLAFFERSGATTHLFYADCEAQLNNDELTCSFVVTRQLIETKAWAYHAVKIDFEAVCDRATIDNATVRACAVTFVLAHREQTCVLTFHSLYVVQRLSLSEIVQSIEHFTMKSPPKLIKRQKLSPSENKLDNSSSSMLSSVPPASFRYRRTFKHAY